MSQTPRYIYVADDFTGATDTLATLARAGQKARLFLDVPSPDEVSDLDAFGVATDARALGNAEIKSLMKQIGAQLKAHQPDILHYKICSTFDSAPDVGNFVTATNQLCQSLDESRRIIVGGQPSLGRYCISGNLFARAYDGKTYRIDAHPVMRVHPVTPMRESDLRVHFTNLGGGEIHLSDPLEPAIEQNSVTLFDALKTSDLARIGAVVRQGAKPLVCIGASSVAQAVFGADQGERPVCAQSFDGPVLGFVGSRSSVSLDQVKQANSYVTISIDPKALETDELIRRAVVLLEQKKNVLIHIIDGQVDVRHARDIALASARLIAAIVSKVQVGLLVVAGGDTSSAIIKQLAPQSLSCLGDIDPGVPMCMAHFTSLTKLPVVLKGGQVGRPDIFDHLSQGLMPI